MYTVYDMINNLNSDGKWITDVWFILDFLNYIFMKTNVNVLTDIVVNLL